MVTTRVCPLCGGRPDGIAFPYRTVWQGHDYSYVRCSDCGCTYLDPVPGRADLAEMYSRENYHDLHYAEIRADGRYRDSARLLRRWCGDRNSLLDFGCGNGSFLIAARREGFDGTGVEYERTAIESAARRSGAPVLTFSEVRASGRRFEIIHLGDVLEHLPSPQDAMLELRQVLAPRGIFFIEGPLESNPSLVHFVARTVKDAKRKLGIDTPGHVAPTHLMLVDRSAQERFLTRALGLRCVHFAVFETGWPYRLEQQTPRRPVAFAKAVIGSVAIAVSWVVRGWGNRFAAILET